MAAIHIRTLPDPILRQKAKKYPVIDPSIRKLLDNMIDTLDEAEEWVLAAPQIGVSLRIVVIRFTRRRCRNLYFVKS